MDVLAAALRTLIDITGGLATLVLYVFFRT